MMRSWKYRRRYTALVLFSFVITILHLRQDVLFPRRHWESLLLGESIITHDTPPLHSSSSSLKDFPFMVQEKVVPEYQFPRWNETTGISMTHILVFLHGIWHGTASINESPKARALYPETPYILDRQGLWVSEAMRSKTWRAQIRNRVEPMEVLIQAAWKKLCHEQRSGTKRWPRLYQAIVEEEAGFPLVAWYGDYRQCGYHNVRHAPNFQRTTSSVPIFTTCAPVECDYAFPLPSYQTIKDSLPTPEAWDERFLAQEQAYPNKVPRSVWRGSLSNNLGPDKEYQQLPRWRLSRISYDLEQSTKNESLVDAGLVWLPKKNLHLNKYKSEIGGFKPEIKPMEDYQRYIGIIDVDGSSWSARFGTILCYDSVVLKVDPEYVDLFMRNLIPGKHYIPTNLSDLVTKASFVANPANARAIHRIKQEAHQFCRHHMIWPKLAEDVLDVFEQYVRYLEIGDPNWQTTWKLSKPGYMSNEETTFNFILRQATDSNELHD